MELTKEKGPIYSRYDHERPGTYSAVVDYAAPPRRNDDIQFILAHKISPGHADPNDMRPTPNRMVQEDTTSAPAKADQPSSWPGQRRSANRTPAQNRAALVGVIIWFLFIIISMLMSLFKK
ncbi:MAG: hypothetical protein ACYDH4_07830 [Candidatus Cryosericum sp.]